MRKVLGVFLAAAQLAWWQGCGLLDSPIRIDLPDQTFSFSVDASSLRSQLEQELGVSLSGQTTIPAQLNLNQTFNLDLPAQQIDFSDEQDLKQYLDAGKIKSVTVKYVQYSLTTNTLNYPVPALEIWLDEAGVSTIGAASKKIAQTEQVPAGQTGNGDLLFTTNGRQILSDFLLGLKFAFLGRTEITIDTSVSRNIPAGQLAGSVTIGLYFSVDPF